MRLLNREEKAVPQEDDREPRPLLLKPLQDGYPRMEAGGTEPEQKSGFLVGTQPESLVYAHRIKRSSVQQLGLELDEE